jgi:hypothetical protein
MRLVAKTAPMRQLEVARELRARVKAALDAAGVQPAGPDTIVISAPPALTPEAKAEPVAAAVIEAEPAAVIETEASVDPAEPAELSPEDRPPPD